MVRRFVCILIVLCMMGCASGPQFVIPDEPKFKTFYAYTGERGVCIDNEGLGIWNANIKALTDYAVEMRKMLEGLQKGK